jgi:hypothetical protein
MAEHSLLSKNKLAAGISFRDLFGTLLNQGFSPDSED